jgi:1-aminocyclopropane-1-carboxylate deaminase/D-cysteine desulfhydrase-like pyridoxal-dependent ACC family enzyme
VTFKPLIRVDWGLDGVDVDVVVVTVGETAAGLLHKSESQQTTLSVVSRDCIPNASEYFRFLFRPLGHACKTFSIKFLFSICKL